MARIKFSSEDLQFNGSIQGQTFYSGTHISSIRNIAQMPKTRMPAQKLMSSYLINADRNWRLLDFISKTIWNNFAIEFPQRTNRDASKFLNGYELYVKRNQHYQIFHEGLPRFMFLPSFTEVFADTPAITIFTLSDRLIISFDYPRSNSDLDCLIGLSRTISAGKSYVGSNHRLIFKAHNLTEDLDITEQYIAIFGKLPIAGECLNYSILQMGSLNAQYFFQDPFKIFVSEIIPPIPVTHLLASSWDSSLATIEFPTGRLIEWFQVIVIPEGSLHSLTCNDIRAGNPNCTLDLEIYSFVDGHEGILLDSSSNTIEFPPGNFAPMTFNFNDIVFPGMYAIKININPTGTYDHDNSIDFMTNHLHEYTDGFLFNWNDGSQEIFLEWSLIGSFTTI